MSRRVTAVAPGAHLRTARMCAPRFFLLLDTVPDPAPRLEPEPETRPHLREAPVRSAASPAGNPHALLDLDTCPTCRLGARRTPRRAASGALAVRGASVELQRTGRGPGALARRRRHPPRRRRSE